MMTLVQICFILILVLGASVGTTGIASAQDDASNDASQSSTATVNGEIDSTQSQSQNGSVQIGGNQTGSPQNTNEQGNVNSSEASILNGNPVNGNNESDNAVDSENTVVGRLLERLVALLSSLLGNSPTID